MSQSISNLAVGSKIKFGSYKVENSSVLPIQWVIADKNHSGYPANSVTLVSDKIIDFRGFDAKEPANANSSRASNGNSRYRTSNIRQWLNSTGVANSWWTAQNLTDFVVNTNNHDTTPADAGFDQLTGYADIGGFLNNFTADELAKILDTTLIVAKNTTTDGGASETVADKVFLLSNTEIGLANYNGIAEGSLLSLFNTSSNRTAYTTQQAFNSTLSTSKPTTVGTAWYWWLRTPDSADYVKRVRSDGALGLTTAYSGDVGVRPALNLDNSLLVSDTVDSDGCYTTPLVDYVENRNGTIKYLYKDANNWLRFRYDDVANIFIVEKCVNGNTRTVGSPVVLINSGVPFFYSIKQQQNGNIIVHTGVNGILTKWGDI